VPDAAVETAASADDFKQWVCVICGWIYDEAAGLPEEGIAAGTRWADVPADWRCPLCDVGKEDFALVEF
jgi:rubredoxin